MKSHQIPDMTNVVITGAAGFIGATLSKHLAQKGHHVFACDWANAQGYTPLDYSQNELAVRLRRGRLAHLLNDPMIRYECMDITQHGALLEYVRHCRPKAVIHLAAQAGVRHSVQAPLDFAGPNLLGFVQVLDACRLAQIPRFLYASSSSVYGSRNDAPFRETDTVGRPQSFYAATKLANEAMAYAYHVQYGTASLGMRFFTVYGPWGRPDMAPLMFARKIRDGESLVLFSQGELERDFTYVDDTVAAIDRLLHHHDIHHGAQIINVGHQKPVQVKKFVEILSRLMGKAPRLNFASMQKGDVALTCASEEKLLSLIEEWPCTPLETGLRNMVDWLREWEASESANVTNHSSI